MRTYGYAALAVALCAALLGAYRHGATRERDRCATARAAALDEALNRVREREREIADIRAKYDEERRRADETSIQLTQEIMRQRRALESVRLRDPGRPAGCRPAVPAAYWKRYYNTPAGKGTVEQYIQSWHAYMGAPQ